MKDAIIALIVLVSLGVIWYADRTLVKADVPVVSHLSETGRYQIVNATSNQFLNVLLLDTWTGATWQECLPLKHGYSWCPISMPSDTSVKP
jgi:hypothetical protein